MLNNISCIETNNGEFIGAAILEVTSVPHVDILRDGHATTADIENEVRLSFGNMLSEIYQSYRAVVAYNNSAEVSVESLWVTEPVLNQPYKAKIRIFIIARSIDFSQERVYENLDRMASACEAALKLNKYGVAELDANSLTTLLGKVPSQTVCSIVKDERVEMMQNQMLPACYAFDKLEASAHDLSAIVNSLIEHPYTAVSFQITPTRFSIEENGAISQLAQVLDTLSKGVMTQGVGNVSITAAESLASVYRYYQANKNNALFSYGILVFGDNRSIEDVASKIYGHLTFDSTKVPALKSLYLSGADVQIIENFIALPWVVNEILVQSDRNQQIWGYRNDFVNFYRLPYVITAEEATEFFRLPLGTQRISAGLTVNNTDSSSKTYSNNLINAGDIEIGLLKSSSNNDSIGISLKDLAKHMLVVGTPGSGKTTFSVGLLDRLWKDHGIPFLVIEPAKNEYRALVQSIPDLQVFTPGKNFISPFVFNPFVPPKNVKLETYKSTLKTAFAAAVSMSTPLDKIFEESINNCYSDFRWLDTYTVDDKGKTFNISDFIKCFQQTFDEIGYTGDAKNIGRAGVVRLKSLVNLFDNYFSIPIEDLLKKPTIIELAAIENSDQKALIISLLLLSILAYVNSNYVGEGGLKNVILLEEAHVLLDADTNAGDANPSAIAQGLVKRMLAEIRSYGVGLVIADQSPRKVSTDVVALTDMKVVFRLVEATDKQIIADSMNMSDAQIQRLSRLKPGEAFLFFNKLDEPEEVITPDYRLENNISITLTDEGIRELSTYWKNKQEMLRPYPECGCIKYCSSTCDYERRILAREIARRLFVRNFTAETTSFDPVKKVLGNITNLVKAELNDEPFSPELLACVKCQLWRRIKYGTKIPVKEVQIVNSLQKS